MLACSRRFADEHPWLTLAIGSIVFGVLMGLRTEFEHWWQRALIAGAAGAVIAWMLMLRRHASAQR